MGRNINVIDTVWAYALEANDASDSPREEAEIAESLFVDYGQNASRDVFGDRLQTFTTKSLYYSYGRDRRILPEEHMEALGHYPRVSFRGMSETTIKKLTGDAESMPMVALVLSALAVCSTMPGLWPNRSDSSV